RVAMFSSVTISVTPRPMRPSRMLLAALALVAGRLDAQAILGTYTTVNPQGGTLTVVLKKTAQGAIDGSLTGNGASYTVQGRMQGDDVEGNFRATTGVGGAFFEAHREGTQLRLILVDAGP